MHRFLTIIPLEFWGALALLGLASFVFGLPGFVVMTLCLLALMAVVP